MDDEYDIDEYDEDLDDFEPEDDPDDKEDDLDDKEDDLSDADVELASSLDGEFDAEHDIPMYGGHGSSVDFDDLTDEQRDLYDDAYHAGHASAE